MDNKKSVLLSKTEGARQIGGTEFFPLARKIIRRKARLLVGLFGFTPDDVPDLEQELSIALLKRCGYYDPAKGKEATFILRVVERKIADLISYRQAGCRDWRQCPHSLNETINMADADDVEFLETLDDGNTSDHALILDVTMVIERLPPDLQEACRLLQNYSIGEIIEGRMASHSVFYRKLERLRRIFKKAGFEKKFC